MSAADALREQMIALLADCGGDAADRMRLRLSRPHSPTDLWMVRCDVFQAIAQAHCESVAARRIGSLTT